MYNKSQMFSEGQKFNNLQLMEVGDDSKVFIQQVWHGPPPHDDNNELHWNN